MRGKAGYVGDDGVARLNVLQLQRYIRNIPKPVIAVVPGFAIGGGHVLHVCCDLTIASDNARFGQTGPIVGSFDAGFGSSYLAAQVGQKKAREIWFLCRQYSAAEAEAMGMVNCVVPLHELEREALAWSREILKKSPLALRFIKAGLNAELDGQTGVQVLAGDATMLFYMTEEGSEGKNAFLEKREPDFSRFPRQVPDARLVGRAVRAATPRHEALVCWRRAPDLRSAERVGCARMRPLAGRRDQAW